ncbi:MAG: hypothetical protein GY792_17245 [Gammaproteobacteria bacterium]|nr:hypothetical protein [Gammaproteobacteria bacterium]
MPNRLAAGLEAAVGVMLFLLGVDVLRRLITQKIHFHSHQHNQCVHFHAHSHAGEVCNRHHASSHEHKHAEGFPVRALLVGLMHGMAGSATLIVLTLQTVESSLMGLVYILLFGVGSIIGMALLSVVIALPLCHLGNRLTWLHGGFQLLVGSATTVLGVLIIYQSYGAMIA